LREELKAKKENSDRIYYLKQQEMALKQRKQIANEQLKTEKAKWASIKEFFSFIIT